MTYNVFGGTLSLTQSINDWGSRWLQGPPPMVQPAQWLIWPWSKVAQITPNTPTGGLIGVKGLICMGKGRVTQRNGFG